MNIINNKIIMCLKCGSDKNGAKIVKGRAVMNCVDCGNQQKM